jgi:hypothetical protein
LADTIAEMKKGGGGGRINPNNRNRDRQKKNEDDGEVWFAKCPICEQVHRAPAKKYCYELECNAYLCPENWVSGVKK